MLPVLQRWGRDFGNDLLGVAIALGLISASLLFFQVIVVLLPFGVLTIGFVSRHVWLAIASAVVVYLTHLFAANIRGLLFAQQLPYQFLLFPGLLFLACFVAISVGAYYAKLFQFRSKQWLGVSLLVLSILSCVAVLPSANTILGPPSSVISFTLEIVANQSSTSGLAIILPAPLLRGRGYPEIFYHRDPGTFNDFQSSIVNTSYGLGLQLNVSSLPEKVVVGPSYSIIDDALISYLWYRPGSVLYRGIMRFSLPMPYPLDTGRPTLELNKGGPFREPSEPCVPPLIDYYYILAGPMWISIPSEGPAGGVKLQVSVNNANRGILDPYSGLFKTSRFGEELIFATRQTGWSTGGGFSGCSGGLVQTATA